MESPVAGPPKVIYLKVDDNPTRDPPVACLGYTLKGAKCTHKTRDATHFCWRHRHQCARGAVNVYVLVCGPEYEDIELFADEAEARRRMAALSVRNFAPLLVKYTCADSLHYVIDDRYDSM